ncbi:hypothetical protein SDC9_82778 [bioreactor metagenome]|uniref:Spore germination protein n=1 Tax=bioreactor metagenome TaxID=1076179 RepID=A0A644ZBT6_9ZZZZ
MGDQIKDKNQIKKQSKHHILYLLVMCLLMMFFVIGSLGYTVAQRMPLPFFSATKMISFIETLDRLEPILLTTWVISDFIIITMFAFISMHIIKSLFAVSETKYFSSPLILLGYFGSQYLTSSRFETELFSNSVVLHLNIVFCFIIPAVILAIGKLRKKI